MQSTPLVSIIIPTFNRAEVVQNAVRSCLVQTYKNIEVIVVDDASTDRTSQILVSISDSRVRYFQHSQNKGPAGARNTGIKNAHGEYLAFLDYDDEWLPEKIERQLNVFEALSSDVGLVFTNGYQEASGREFFSKNAPSGVSYAPARDKFFPLRVLIAPPSAWMLSLKVVRETGYFDESMYCWEDGDFLARVAYKYPLYFLNESLVIWHAQKEHLNSISSRLLEGKEIFIKNNIEELRKDKEYFFQFYRTLGKDACKVDKGRARGYFVKALKIRPFDLRVVYKLFKTF